MSTGQVDIQNTERAAADTASRWQVGKVGVGGIAVESVESAIKHDVLGLAAEIAYRSGLALVPFLLILAALPSVIGSILSTPDLGDRLTRELRTLISNDVGDMMGALLNEVSQTRGWTAFFIGLAGTLWMGTSTTSAIRKALNRVYAFDENEPFLKRKLIEIAVTLVVDVLAFCALLVVIIGPHLLGESLGPLRHLISAAVSFVLLLGAVSVIYWLAPAAENQFKWITPGAALFAVVWLAFSIGFSFYFTHFWSLNRVYGFLGVMLVVLIWLYWSAIALLLGAEVNSAVARRYEPELNSQQMPGERKTNGG
jgi:membrane protein